MSFDFDFTSEHLKQILKNNKEADQWFDSIIAIFPQYEITTVSRVAAFLAQCGHESNNFTVLSENLNYSSQGMANTWPNRFAEKDSKGKIIKPITPNSLAMSLHRKPEKIANTVYANRIGNGGEASGDGFRYRGRGLIQLTGKENYQSFADSIDMSLDDIVEYCETKDGAIESACWFWDTRKINELVDNLPDGEIDDADFIAITKKINGGTVGLSDRTEKFNKIIRILEG